jgi:hypothetical protein
MIGDAGEQVGDIVLRVESVELGALNQRIDRRCAATAGIGLLPDMGRLRSSGPKVRFAADSPLEGDGFELSVPRQSDGRFPRPPRNDTRARWLKGPSTEERCMNCGRRFQLFNNGNQLALYFCKNLSPLHRIGEFTNFVEGCDTNPSPPDRSAIFIKRTSYERHPQSATSETEVTARVAPPPAR